MSAAVAVFVRACCDAADAVEANASLSPPKEVARVRSQAQLSAAALPIADRAAFIAQVSDRLRAEAGPAEVIGGSNGVVPRIEIRERRGDFLASLATAIAALSVV